MESIWGYWGEPSVSAKKVVDFVEWINKNDDDVIILNVRAENTSSNLVTFEPFCDVEFIEKILMRTRVFSAENFKLFPQEKTRFGTNDYQLKNGEHRDYVLRLPNNKEAKELLEREASTIQLKIFDMNRRQFRSEIPFTRDEIAKQKILIKFTE